MTDDSPRIRTRQAPMPWAERGACREMDTAMWFPWRPFASPTPAERAAYRGDVQQAKQVCEGCPVRQECEDHGIRHEKYGIWGGLDEEERKRMRRARSRLARIQREREVL